MGQFWKDEGAPFCVYVETDLRPSWATYRRLHKTWYTAKKWSEEAQP